MLRFSRRGWRRLIKELGRRGEGRREAGAFLLAEQGDPTVTVRHVAYFDDLDPDALQGNIHIKGSAFGRLWDLCDTLGLVVVGDAHTHGATFVQQSETDRANPMVARAGHVALVVPHLGAKRSAPRHVGVHVYLGDEGWRSLSGRGAARRVRRRWRP